MLQKCKGILLRELRVSLKSNHAMNRNFTSLLNPTYLQSAQNAAAAAAAAAAAVSQAIANGTSLSRKREADGKFLFLSPLFICHHLAAFSPFCDVMIHASEKNTIWRKNWCKFVSVFKLLCQRINQVEGMYQTVT